MLLFQLPSSSLLIRFLLRIYASYKQLFLRKTEADPMKVFDYDVFFPGKHFTQSRNKNIQAPAHKIIIIAPDGFQDILSFQDRIFVPDKIKEEFGLPLGKGDCSI